MDDALAPVKPEPSERRLEELAHGVGLAGGEHEVVRPVVLQDAPHPLHEVAGKPPVAPSVEIAEEELVLKPKLDARGGAGDLAGHKRLAAPRGLVVEENAVRGENAVRLAVVPHRPVGVELGDGVGRAGMKRRRFALRAFRRHAEELRSRRLVEAHVAAEIGPPNRLEKPDGAERVDFAGVLGHVKRHANIALRGKIVDFVGANLAAELREPSGIGQVAVVQDESAAFT